MAAIKKNYHWLIAAVLLLQLFLIGGIYNNLSNLFLLPVTESLQISRSSFSLAVSVKGLCAFISTFFSGALLHRFGYRKMVTFLMITNAIGLLIMATSKDLVTLAIGLGLLGLGDGICLSAGPPRLVRHWFHKHQGLVLGCISAATGLGGSALCFLFSGIIESSGWQSAFVVSAVLFSVMTVLLFVVVRNQPEELGLKPYGEGQYAHKKQESPTRKWSGFSWEQLLRRPAFYLLLLGSFLACFCTYALSQTVVPHLRSIGYSNAQAVSVQSVLMLVLAGTKLGFGALSDRIGGKRITMLCLGSMACSLGIMAIWQNIYAVWVSVILLACGLPLTMLTVPLLVPDLFGYRGQTMAVGVLMSTASLASMTAPAITNAVYDKLGTYRPMFAVVAMVAVGLMALYGVIYLMVSRDKKKLCV
ncbi:MAG: MFS transporter [Oscillospiraceae bacterium]|nr:MFS transporter [Oscillospiraceae bacterium]